MLGKGIAMNAFRNGALESLSMKGWLKTKNEFFNFAESLKISNKDHELWYGDKKIAGEMQKDDLVKRMHFNLKLMNITDGNIGNFGVNYKALKKQKKPEWPVIL